MTDKIDAIQELMQEVLDCEDCKKFSETIKKLQDQVKYLTKGFNDVVNQRDKLLQKLPSKEQAELIKDMAKFIQFGQFAWLDRTDRKVKVIELLKWVEIW